MGKTPEVLIPALRQYRHNYGSEQYIAGFDYDDTVKIVRDLERQLAKREADIREMIEKAAAKHRPAYDAQQRKICGLEQQLSTLRGAAQAVVDSEGVVYPIPASHSYKVATLKAALEVDSVS